MDQRRELIVSGTCTCTKTGYTLKLEAANAGVVPQPDIVTLQLVVTEPEFGEDTVTDTQVETYITKIGPASKEVHIRVPDGPDLVVRIEDAPDR
jgi:hypothetical protein